jgi:hypothetical protein
MFRMCTESNAAGRFLVNSNPRHDKWTVLALVLGYYFMGSERIPSHPQTSSWKRRF